MSYDPQKAKALAENLGAELTGFSEEEIRSAIRSALGEHDMIVRIFGAKEIRAVIASEPDAYGGITPDELDRVVAATMERTGWGTLRELNDRDRFVIDIAARIAVGKVLGRIV